MTLFVLSKLRQGAGKSIQICLKTTKIEGSHVSDRGESCIRSRGVMYQIEGSHVSDQGEFFRRNFDVCQKEKFGGILFHFKNSVFVKLNKDSFHFARDLIVGAVYLSPKKSIVYKEGRTGINPL